MLYCVKVFKQNKHVQRWFFKCEIKATIWQWLRQNTIQKTFTIYNDNFNPLLVFKCIHYAEAHDGVRIKGKQF